MQGHLGRPAPSRGYSSSRGAQCLISMLGMLRRYIFHSLADSQRWRAPAMLALMLLSTTRPARLCVAQGASLHSCRASMSTGSSSANCTHPNKPAWPAGDARIILGSSSYSRQAIMKELAQEYGFSYDTLTADIDEQALGDRQRDPAALVALLAQAKAEAILAKLRASEQRPLKGYLLTCDQVVVHDNKIREKPVSQQQARDFIASYSRSPAGTVGAVQCTDLSSGQTFSAVDFTWTHFQPIPSDAIEQVIQEGTVMKCAGALMVENPVLMPYITKVQGSQDAVMGLPKAIVLQVITSAVTAASSLS